MLSQQRTRDHLTEARCECDAGDKRRDAKDTKQEQFIRIGAECSLDVLLKSEGYGIVRVNHEEEVFDIECWPRDADPTAADTE